MRCVRQFANTNNQEGPACHPPTDRPTDRPSVQEYGYGRLLPDDIRPRAAAIRDQEEFPVVRRHIVKLKYQLYQCTMKSLQAQKLSPRQARQVGQDTPPDGSMGIVDSHRHRGGGGGEGSKEASRQKDWIREIKVQKLISFGTKFARWLCFS